ncbi:hepatocellular carcinoma-associated antigen 59-domain-containing protein [Catenaria anguillulae PL171]|uniref:Hepatocellular carcinoma-associated antigen 59-domain-containing protein n=1 Tax=Catenaria anguillulae PL171 TaxID=765915 RepID=A0A1Y2HMP8_9FUNG|nr:hepatocellular carcinoma-associated antigen 59-domain-containing protein [Catenaria anguillulae PL171]
MNSQSRKPSSPIEVFSSTSSPHRRPSPTRRSLPSPSEDSSAAAQPDSAAASVPSAPAPAFIKRSSVRKANLRKPTASAASSRPNDAPPLSPDKPNSSDNPIDLIADIKYARKLRARGGRGVDAGTLVAAIAGGADEDAGDKDAAEKGLPDISKLESISVGGLSKAGGAKEKEGYLSSFTGTNKTLDATKHMERYIEEQLAKRRQLASASTTASSDATTGAGSTTAAPISYDDELYTLPEHLRTSKPDVIEGSVTASAAMLTAIPEIDLGPESKSKAIVQTERLLARTANAQHDLLEHDLAFHNNPFPSMRWRISRKTRESLYDMTHGAGAAAGAADVDAAAVEQAVADELTRDRRGQRTVGAQGIVTNDDELRRRFELERRLGEVSSGREVRSVKVDHKEREVKLRGREREAEPGDEGESLGKKRRVGEAE